MVWYEGWTEGRKTRGEREAGQTDRPTRNEGGGLKGRVWVLKRKRSSLSRGGKEITVRVAGVEDCHCSLWERQTFKRPEGAFFLLLLLEALSELTYGVVIRQH